MKQFVLLCLCLLLLVTLTPSGVRAENQFCDHPANLTHNCDMNTFSDSSSNNAVRVVADGWSVWVEAGNPAFDYGGDSPVPPSQRIWSDGGAFTGGMYQQVSNLTPGATYAAGVVWA
nr:hypothetical protein [Ardenticatenales bacterium]